MFFEYPYMLELQSIKNFSTSIIFLFIVKKLKLNRYGKEIE
jgi:hypothetical protein